MSIEDEMEKFSTLPFSEQLLLWGIRLWVRGHQEAMDMHAIICRGFELAGPAKVPAILDGFMSVLATGGNATIDVRCPACSSVSNDEQLILGAVGDLQCGEDGAKIRKTLSAWLPSASLRLAEAPLLDLAQNLADAGLIVRPRHEFTETQTAIHSVAPTTVH